MTAVRDGRRLRFTALALILSSALGLASPLPAQPRMTVRPDGMLELDGHPYRGVGVNYLDCFYRKIRNPSDTSYEDGFADLDTEGVPFARFMALAYWPSELSLYQVDRASYLARMDAVVATAESHGIGLVPSLFWTHFTVPGLVGETCNQVGNANSLTVAFMREYAQTIVTRYLNSPAIWAWEFGNEWSLWVDLTGFGGTPPRPPMVPQLGTPGSRTAADDITTDMMRVAYQEVVTTIRSVDPDRPVFTGNSMPRTYAESIRLGENPLVLDSHADFGANMSLVNEAPFDGASVHMYPDDLDYERFESGHFPTYDELLSEAHGAAHTLLKPLYLGEFGANDLLHGGSAQAQQHIQSMLDALVDTRVDLASIWVFDRIVDVGAVESAWNITTTNGRNYVFPMLRAANEALVTAVEGSAVRGGARLRIAPNPVATTARVTFAWSGGEVVAAELFDVTGRMVRTLSPPFPLSPGVHHLTLDACDEAGRPLPNGLYFCRIRGHSDQLVGRLAITR